LFAIYIEKKRREGREEISNKERKGKGETCLCRWSNESRSQGIHNLHYEGFGRRIEIACHIQ